MGTFMTSDTHFFDDAIIKYEGRPFINSREMNEALISKWNEKIGDEDVVWHMGDVAFANTAASLTDIVSRLKGHKRLIKGNHDPYSNKEYREAGFEEVYDYPILFNGFYILSHEPIYMTATMPYANIHGHIHGKKMVGAHYCNVSVEHTGYAPIPFSDIETRFGITNTEKKV